jgi:hypothetical protein
VSIPATGVAVSPPTARLKTKGDNKWLKLTATVLPVSGGAPLSSDTVTWSSEDVRIATVDRNGKLTGVREGRTTVSAVAGGARADVPVIVENIRVDKVTLSEAKLSMTVGQTHTLKAEILPKDAYDRTVSWSASPAGIVTVDAAGVVTALKPGKATVTASADGGRKQATCAVTVKAPASEAAEEDVRGNEDLDLRLAKHEEGKMFVRNTVRFDYITYEAETGQGADTRTAQCYELQKRLVGGKRYVLVGRHAAGSKAAQGEITDRVASKGANYVYMLIVYRDSSRKVVVTKETLTVSKGKKVKSLSVSALTKESVGLKWKKMDGVSGYKVYRSTDDRKYTCVASLDAASFGEWTDTGRKPKTKYYYKVYAYTKGPWASDARYLKTVMHRPASGSTTTDAPRLELSYSSFGTGKGNRIWFGAVPGAGYYVLEGAARPYESLYKEIDSKKLSYASGKSGVLYDKSANPSSESYYRVTAYDKKGGKRITHASLSVNVDLKGTEVTGFSAKAHRTKPQVTLRWTRVGAKADGYKIYRSESSNGLFRRVKTLGAGKGKWTDKGVEHGTKYYYKIVAYRETSKVSKASLYGQWQYYRKPASASARTSSLVAYATEKHFEDNYAFALEDLGKAGSKQRYDAVQYELVTSSTLRIHIYYEATGDAEEIALKEASFIEGVEGRWGGVEVTNAQGDFARNVAFTTRVVLHRKSPRDNAKQKYVEVKFGGECRETDTGSSSYHWYHAHASEGIIYMPSDQQVEDIGRVANEGDEYLGTSAHEMGHILGLYDAYWRKRETPPERLIANDETTTKTFPDNANNMRHDNIMSSSRYITHALSNDIEMALYAKYQEIRFGGFSYQAYATFDDTNGNSYDTSVKIRNRVKGKGYEHN